MRFRVLGPVEYFDGHRWQSLSSPKQRSLLAFLLLHADRLVATDQLVEELWGGEQPRSATNLVHQYVLRLRRVLGDRPARLLATRPDGYQLNLADAGALDSRRFAGLVAEARLAGVGGDAARAGAQLREGLGLWRGRALADVTPTPAIQLEAARLEELRLTAVEARIDTELEWGHSDGMVPELRTLVREHPLRERLWGQLMRVLYRAGRQADALTAYHEVRGLLDQELAVEPGTELRALHQRILRGDPALAGPPAAAAPARGTRPAGTSAGPEQPHAGLVPRQLPADTTNFRQVPRVASVLMTLTERDLELATVDARLASATDGAGSILVVEGPPGIGKTALLSAARTRAGARGLRVLAAVGGELDQELPFAIVRQLFEPPLRSAPADIRADLMAGTARLASPVLAPDAPGPDHSSGVLGNMVHGLYWLCSNFAEARPLLLTVDDVHWADNASLRFVSHLARRITDLPVLLLVAGRPGAMLDSLVARALGGVRPEILRLRPLTITGVSQIVRRDLDSNAEDAFCLACAKASGGNPFLLAEALTGLREDGVPPVAAEAWRVERLRPEAIARSVITRIGRAGPDGIRLARALAVLGPAVELHQVARLAELPLDRAVTLADVLTHETIIGQGRPLDFAHPLIRTAVYADFNAVRRSAEHKRAALVLADDGCTASQIVPHLLTALPAADPWVVNTLRAASSAALGRGAPELATAYLTRALAEPPAPADTAVLHAELGRALTMANRLDDASAAYHQALSLIEAPPERARIALELCFLMTRSGRGSQAIEAAELAHQSIDRAVADLAHRVGTSRAGPAPATGRRVRRQG